MLHMTVDVFYDIPMDGWEIIVLLIPEYRNIVKKGIEDHKYKSWFYKP